MTHPAPLPHGPIREIRPDVFMVRGSIRMNPLIRISRNMAIVRHGGELTLIDPIRLSEEGEGRLRELGRVARILRLGPFHGCDDPWYVERFGVPLWAPGESEAHPEPKPDVFVGPGTPLPFPDAELFCFEGARQREAALRIGRDGGLLLTCDAIQHYGDYRFNGWLARLLMPWIGFPRTTVVGPFWLKLMTPEGGSLEGEFRRLLDLEFDQLLSAHGSLLERGAHAAVEAAVERAFGG